MLEMKMHFIMALLSLALLMSTEPASAQKTYSVVVSRHSGVPPLSDQQVKGILADASKLLKKNPGHQDTEDNVACDVTFTLKEPVHTFDSPGKKVWWPDEIEPVHHVNSHLDVDDGFHVKVVEATGYCRGRYGTTRGCAYPPDLRSIIVVHPKMHEGVSAHVVWAHEFGHLTGLPHRNPARAERAPHGRERINDDRPLMKCGGVTNLSVRVNRYECGCMLAWRSTQACLLPPIPVWC
jgi:hypothetical protein